MNSEDILALKRILNLVEEFFKKNIIRKNKINLEKIKREIEDLSILKETSENIKLKLFSKILKKLNSIIRREISLNIYYIFGAHGGIILDDTGFCEFDYPAYALDKLLEKMDLAVKTSQPYNLEIAITCLEWLRNNHPKKFSEFLKLFKQGKFEIINPTFSQPYSLIIGPESNLKQFEYGIKTLQELDLDSEIFYSSESSIHPQMPQILKGFNINYVSLRTRLLGIHPTSNSALINWIGLDDTVIDAIIDQSGIFNGEYWHGTFFKEIPSLLFQAVSRPFFNYILYSCLEDFVNPQPYQEDVWSITKFSEIFGRFLLCSDIFNQINKDGDFKYLRDDFVLADNIFIHSQLFLYNKNSEISILTAEVLNCILGLFTKNSSDLFFDEVWKKLLLTQAHDCYAVPFIRTRDYSQLQLSKKDLKKLEIRKNSKTISEIAIKIHKEIQEVCYDFINKSLTYLLENIRKENINEADNIKSIFIFNPIPYVRRDIISIQIELDDSLNYILYDNQEKINYQYQDSELKFISEIPGFGYKIFKLIKKKAEENTEPIENKSSFFYSLNISEDLQSIEIKFNDILVYDLKFHSKYNYELTLKETNSNGIEERNLIKDISRNQSFELEIIQYNGVNRLEFVLNSKSLEEILLIPKFKINKVIRNYPFGMEETKKTKFQTLDFIWLKGINREIVYIQKNSQQFTINQNPFEIKNLIRFQGKYEFTISIANEKDISFPFSHISSYYFRLLGVSKAKEFKFTETSESFLSIKPIIPVINLWRRENGAFIRLFNPNDENLSVKLDGRLIKTKLREVDFKNNIISQFISNEIKMGKWKIKNLRF